jgi:hypothetical protein
VNSDFIFLYSLGTGRYVYGGWTPPFIIPGSPGGKPWVDVFINIIYPDSLTPKACSPCNQSVPLSPQITWEASSISPQNDFIVMFENSITVSPNSMWTGSVFGRLRYITIYGANTDFDKTSQVSIKDVNIINARVQSATKIRVLVWIPSKLKIAAGEKEVKVTTGTKAYTGSIIIQ